MAKKKKEAKGATRQTQMRLGAEVLADLDRLVAAFAEESGDRATRSSVVRMLVRREIVRRFGKRES